MTTQSFPTLQTSSFVETMASRLSDIKSSDVDSNINSANSISSKFVFYQPDEKEGNSHSRPPCCGAEQNIVPHKFDVLCGRDKLCHNHIGNHRFRVMIEMYRTAYQMAPSKEAKMRITKEIVATVTSNGFRFLKKIGGDGSGSEERWTELDEAMARDKVSHALRGAKDPHQQQQLKKRQSRSSTLSSSKSSSIRSAVQGVAPTTAPLQSTQDESTVINTLKLQPTKLEISAKDADNTIGHGRKCSPSPKSVSSTSTSESQYTSEEASDSSQNRKEPRYLSSQPQTHRYRHYSKKNEHLPYMQKATAYLPVPVYSVAVLRAMQSAIRNSSMQQVGRDIETNRVKRQQRLLELSVMHDESFRNLPTESFLPTTSPLQGRRRDRPVQSSSNITSTEKYSIPSNSDLPSISCINPIGITSFEEDETGDDEPPTITDLVNDNLLCEALLADSLRQQRMDEILKHCDHAPTPQPPLSMESSRLPVHETTSLSPLQLSTKHHAGRQTTSVRPNELFPLSNDAGTDGSYDDNQDDDSDDEPPTIADLMNDKMLCEAILGSLRLAELDDDDQGSEGSEPVQMFESVRSMDKVLSLISRLEQRGEVEALATVRHGDESLQRIRPVRVESSRPGNCNDGANDEGEDDDEPPSLADLMSDNAARDALMGALRHKKAETAERDGDLEELVTIPMIDSVRSVQTIMSIVSQQDEDQLPRQTFGDLMPYRAVTGENTIIKNDDDDEPPTISEILNDNMLCEALLSSLRLDSYKSEDDISKI